MAQEGEEKPAGGSMVAFLAVLVVLALVGAGAGAGFSMMVLQKPASAAAAKVKEGEGADVAHAPAAPKDEKAGESAADLIAPLAPILVSIGGKREHFLRVELAVLFNEKVPERAALLADINTDLVAFLSTLTVEQLDSASGLEFLREDLAEIVQLRTKKRARGVILKSLMVE
jgi:flagellar FliL protein